MRGKSILFLNIKIIIQKLIMSKKITVNEQIIDWEENMTVDRILEIMKYTFKMIVVKVNNELVKKEHYKTRVIPESADVRVIHLVAGG